jgi:hypothetical protein
MNIGFDADYQPVFYDHGNPVVNGLARALADIASVPAELQRQRTRNDVAMSEIEGARRSRIRDALITYLETGVADPAYQQELAPYASEAQRRLDIRGADQNERQARQEAERIARIRRGEAAPNPGNPLDQAAASEFKLRSDALGAEQKDRNERRAADRVERIRKGDVAPQAPVPLEMAAAAEGKQSRDAAARLVEERANALDIAGLGRLMGAGGRGKGGSDGMDSDELKWRQMMADRELDANGTTIYDQGSDLSARPVRRLADGKTWADAEPTYRRWGLPVPAAAPAAAPSGMPAVSPGMDQGSQGGASSAQRLSLPAAAPVIIPNGAPGVPPSQFITAQTEPDAGPRRPGAISPEVATGYNNSRMDGDDIAKRLGAIDPAKGAAFLSGMEKAHKAWFAAYQAGDKVQAEKANQAIIRAKDAANAEINAAKQKVTK